MKYVSITGKDHFEEHPIDNDVIEYAARITAEAHTLINEDDPWVVSVHVPNAGQSIRLYTLYSRQLLS